MSYFVKDLRPVNPDHGTYENGLGLYTRGYDVHMYDEEHVNLSGEGAVCDEVVEAIQLREVDNVVSVGFSYGGSSTRLLAQRLQTWAATPGTNDFDIAYTAYIDAVKEPDPAIVVPLFFFPEDRRPPGTSYHANFYQLGPGPLIGGGPMLGPEPEKTADENKNVGDVPHVKVDDLFFVQNRIAGRIVTTVPR